MKAFRVMTIQRMETKSKESFDKLRSEIFGFVTDQGVERGVADVNILGSSAAPRAFQGELDDERLYPNALWIPDHLHLFYNALETAVTKLAPYDKFISKLRAVERFLSSKSLRRAFVASCVEDPRDAKLFEHFSSIHIEWRWEYLSKSLGQIIQLLGPMRRWFSPQKLSSSDDGKTYTNWIKEVTGTLSQGNFPEFAEIVLNIGKMLEIFAHTVEGCSCHAHLWGAKRSATSKKRILKSQTGHEHCYMKGRQLVWFQTEGMAKLFGEIRCATTPHLQKLLAQVDPGSRAATVDQDRQIRESLFQELQAKLAFHNCCPYSCAKIFYAELHGCSQDATAKARSYYTQLCMEYDALMESGRGKLHRVAHRVFGKRIRVQRWVGCFPRRAWSVARLPHRLQHHQAVRPAEDAQQTCGGDAQPYPSHWPELNSHPPTASLREDARGCQS